MASFDTIALTVNMIVRGQEGNKNGTNLCIPFLVQSNPYPVNSDRSDSYPGSGKGEVQIFLGTSRWISSGTLVQRRVYVSLSTVGFTESVPRTP